MYEVRFKKRRRNKPLVLIAQIADTQTEALTLMDKYDYSSYIHYVDIDDVRYFLSLGVCIKGNLITSVYKP